MAHCMKILHVLDHSIPLHSGYSFRTCAILKQQHKLGWETFHVTSAKQINSTGGKELVDGLEFYRSKDTPGASSYPLINEYAIITTLRSRIEEVARLVKPDILHAHSPALNGLAALKAGKKLALPVVYEVRAFWEDAAVDHGTSREWGLRYRMTRALESYVMKHADAITTICEGLKCDIVARGIPQQKVTVIPNAVDVERFHFDAPYPHILARNLDLEEKQVIGFIGSFYAYEGISRIVTALPAIRAVFPDIRLLLVGGGPEEGRLKKLVSQMCLDEAVIFTGRVPHEQVEEYYRLIDILVYPRISMRLTDLVTPLKPLEAMAQGNIVLASDVGGHKELISHGENGFIFHGDEPDSLSQAVINLYLHRENWPDIKRAARCYVEEKRNWAASVSTYQSVYHSLLK